MTKVSSMDLAPLGSTPHHRVTSSALEHTTKASVVASGDIELKVMESNPVLEAFGNAQTLRNENSSRFGKYLQLYFERGHICGASVSYFLLERSRVVSHVAGERSFHVLYWLYGGSDESIRRSLGLGDEFSPRYR